MAYFPGDKFVTSVNCKIPNGSQIGVMFNKEPGWGGRYKLVYADPNCIQNEGNEAEIICIKKAGYDYPALWVIAASKVCEGCPFATDCPAYKPDLNIPDNTQTNNEP